jgi:carbon monoxide dehydrogenase subunit G
VRVTGSFDVGAVREKVWTSIFSNDTIAAWVPGATRVVWAGEDRIEATLQQAIIGFKVLLDATLEVREQAPPERLVLHGQGEDRTTKSRVEFDLHVTLSPTPEGGTRVEYRNDVTLAGRLAAAGDFLVRSRQKEIHHQLIASVRRALEV